MSGYGSSLRFNLSIFLISDPALIAEPVGWPGFPLISLKNAFNKTRQIETNVLAVPSDNSLLPNEIVAAHHY